MTGTDRGSVPKDRPTPTNTHTKNVYEVLRRQKISREVNGSQSHRYPPEFDEFEGVTWSATKPVFAKEDILRQNIRYL